MSNSTTHSFLARIRAIRRDIQDEYLSEHSIPWIVGFSGGKDSTLVLQLVFEALLRIPPADRTRPVHVASNDTLVESPVVQAFVDRTLARVTEGSDALNLPVQVHKTTPDPDQTFWVNLLGRGYPAPNRSFRWCTDRMKIRPTTRLIHDVVSTRGEAILLLGARRAESAARARVVQRYSKEGERLNPHNDVPGCLVYRPIVDLTADDVWQLLLQCRPPWGGTHRDLITLYRNAGGGECPFVLSKADAPSCGTNSARFGCWTCTVVEKDGSLEGLIDAGFDQLEPLWGFRNRLKEISGTPNYRSKVRRNGSYGLGPLTLEARRLLLDELLETQREADLLLISDDEVRRIHEHWHNDQITDAIRAIDKADLLVQLREEGGELA